MNTEKLREIEELMDDADVPAEDRMIIVTSKAFERMLYVQAPWWKKLLFEICPWVLFHDWTANTHSEPIEYRDGMLFNYLVCRKCGMVTDHFDVLSFSEFRKRLRIRGCLK